MKSPRLHKTDLTQIASEAAYIPIIFSGAVIALLGLLHIVSPELDPSWRMVSEYANGQYPGLLTMLFVVWGLASLSLAYVLRSQLNGRLGKAGLILLIISGIGELMAAAFDINHALHSLASFLGIGGAVLAALVINLRLARTKGWQKYRTALLTTANSVWISLALMGVTFGLLVLTFMSVISNMSPDSTAVDIIPEGVIAVVGWANRLVVIVFSVWLITLSWLAHKLGK